MFKLFLSLFLVFTINLIHAQSGEIVSLEELGLSFEIPAGWTGTLEAEAFLLGHHSLPGLMILTQNQSNSAASLKALAMKGIYTDGIALRPVDAFWLKGQERVEGFYQGNFDGAKVKCFAIGLINGLGSGMNIFILTETGKFADKHVTEAKKLASSVQFFRSRDAALTTTWKAKIVGKQLTYMHTSTSSDYSGGSSGISDRRIIKLFPNGSFSYYSNSQSSFSAGDGASGQSGFGYADATRSNQGNFKIYTIGNDSYLELYFEDDKIYEYALKSTSDGKTLLNDSRYFVKALD